MSAVAQEKYLDGVLASRSRAESALSGGAARGRSARQDDGLATVITLPYPAAAADQSASHRPECVCVPLPTSADEKWFHDRKHPRS